MTHKSCLAVELHMQELKIKSRFYQVHRQNTSWVDLVDKIPHLKVQFKPPVISRNYDKIPPDDLKTNPMTVKPYLGHASNKRDVIMITRNIEIQYRSNKQLRLDTWSSLSSMMDL